MNSLAKSVLCFITLCVVAPCAAQERHATGRRVSRQSGGTTMLMRAAEGGRASVVRALLKKGVDVNARDGHGRTALMLTAARGHLQVVKLLLAAGADPNLRAVSFHAGDLTALTAAMEASPESRVEIIDALLAAGAQLNPADAGRTPLIRAVEKKDLSLMKLLLNRGADVNWKNRSGLTLLMAAVAEGSPDAVKFLIDAGADVNAQSNDGKTALSLAEEIYNESRRPAQAVVVRLLKAAGARP
jgi:ankyrin repeat protein